MFTHENWHSTRLSNRGCIAGVDKREWANFVEVVVRMEGKEDFDEEGLSVLRLVLVAPDLLKAAKAMIEGGNLDQRVTDLQNAIEKAESGPLVLDGKRL